LPDLVRALRLVKSDATLVLAGEGGERKRLEKLVAELGIDMRVRFAGYVRPDATLPFYAMAYALVLPSVTTKAGKETWGLVVNEAMNQGVPVIATESVGAAAGGLVRDGVNGFVVPERNPAALAKAMESLLGSQHLRDEMGRNAREIVARWDNEQMIRGFEAAIAFAMHKDDALLTSS
jgi:glycosyltransferase involved in cell wall biosynthesis